MPEATDETVSNAQWAQGTFHALLGYMDVVTSRQEVALLTTIFLGAAFDTRLTAIATPHPAHMLWPGEIRPCFSSLSSWAALAEFADMYIAS
jgi:hypothetical protein